MNEINKIKEKREEIINFLKKEKITRYDWEMLIKNYIDEKYESSTLS